MYFCPQNCRPHWNKMGLFPPSRKQQLSSHFFLEARLRGDQKLFPRALDAFGVFCLPAAASQNDTHSGREEDEEGNIHISQAFSFLFLLLPTKTHNDICSREGITPSTKGKRTKTLFPPASRLTTFICLYSQSSRCSTPGASASTAWWRARRRT